VRTLVVLPLCLAAAGVAALVAPDLGKECRDGVHVLEVASAPEMAPVVAEAARTAGASGRGCWRAKVTARPAVNVLDDLKRGRGHWDVWIPDSAVWVRFAADAGVPLASQAGPLATSPVVLGLPASAAEQLGRPVDFSSVLASGGTRHPVGIGWPEPDRSAPAVAALLGIDHAAKQPGVRRSDLVGLMRAATMGLAPETDQRLGQQVLAVPVTEQSVWAYNATSAEPVVAAYSSAAGSSLDYPFIVTDSAPDTTRAAADLLAALSGKQGRLLLQSRGFRDATGKAGTALQNIDGIDPTADAGVGTPTPGQLATARTMLGTLNRGSRVLAVVDVSGSMAELVPGTRGLSRLDLTVRAAAAGLSLLPARSHVGLWEFSANLGPGTDYRELVPIGPLAGRQGPGGAGALAAGLGGLHAIPDASTGLYDTTLAAVRRVRAGYDPTRTNAVVLLTDGANQDPAGLDLARLLDRLRAEDDPTRAVPVISVAYGPDSDAASLRAISDVTGGTTYVSVNPRRIREVFLDAIGQRLCRPDCALTGRAG